MIYLETNSTDPCFNLAAEEFLLTDRKEDSYLMLWQNDNTIVVGRNQNTSEEINGAFVKEHGIRVVRRPTGGGAVYHDLGNLNYSFITDLGEGEHSMTRFTEPVCRALKTLGLQAETSGRNDILVDGKKVSGVAERILGKRILHHGCILFDTDQTLLCGALRANREKFESKGIKSVSSRVANIRSLLKEDMDMKAFWQTLRSELLTEGAEQGSFTEEELSRIHKNAKEKYGSWTWTYGKSPAFTYRNTARFDGGTVEVLLEVKDGVILDAALYGDYMALESNEPLIHALRGTRYERAEIEKILSGTDLPVMFGTIGKEDLLRVLFSGA